MHLKTVFIRFYKSFNDDFIRKNEKNVKRKPWELINNVFYPYIEVPIDNEITTIVGANESGKSHLLSAIKKAISGKNIERSDFCRYSHFFTVRRNELKYPDFGTKWSELSESEQSNLTEILNLQKSVIFDHFLLFRQNITNLTVYLPEKGKYQSYELNEKQSCDLQKLLPEILEIKSNIALPPSVPIKILAELERADFLDSRTFEMLAPKKRNEIIDALDEFADMPEVITKIRSYNGKQLEEIQSSAIKPLKSIISALDGFEDYYKDKIKEFELAYKLICKIAQVDADALIDLAEAIKKGDQGYSNGIIEQINRQLSLHFNFQNYWIQDRNFSLKVMARDYDLVFTITDRTGTEYSFDERSQGLRYFLSYYIQYRSHASHPNKSEILLMDEPDAYLSSQAQQDLLKVFNLFANPERNSHLTRPIQVVYVTHSPFLIDKNHPERIRVLQKGNDDEGTRVVKNAVKNHYEPLRSSIGAYFGERAFIGNCNLMVEGITDKILIAGATTYLQRSHVSNLETLDLNQITIVDSEGASKIPYFVYLARGRDYEKSAVIVLLDSDESGDDAKKKLLGKGGQHRKPILKEEFILQIGDIREKYHLASEVITKQLEIEDLIPLPICIQATKYYLQEFIQINVTDLSFLTEDTILKNISSNRTTFDVIKATLSKSAYKEFNFEKFGFARNIVRVVNEWSKIQDLSEKQADTLKVFSHNFKTLFTKLNYMQRRAQQQSTEKKLSQKIERLKKDFKARHPIAAKREDGVRLLDQIDYVLDSNRDNESIQEIEAIQNAIQNLRRYYELHIDMNREIKDYLGFQQGLERIKYAGLIASQEEFISESKAEESLEGVSDEVQIEDSTGDESAKVEEQQDSTDSAEGDDRSSKSSSSRKKNSPKKP